MMTTDRPKPRYQVSEKINIDELEKNIEILSKILK